MTAISYLVKVPPQLSPRTASYVATLIREGDRFDYSKWLQEVRENERRAQQALAGTPDELFFRESGSRSRTPRRPDVLPHSGVAATITAATPTTIWRPNRRTEDETREARLTRRLVRICEAWNDFQSSRARDAVYGYLVQVFAIVEHYRARRKTGRLLRHAYDFADLPSNENADPFTAIIRCTSDDSVDGKMISKWARALRYVIRCKKPSTPLERFVKKMGGINACADLYAQRTRRSNQ